MDEEQMWKSLYEKLEEIKAQPQTEHDNKIQSLDGGFFERFGSLLAQKSSESAVPAPALAPLNESTIPTEELPEDASNLASSDSTTEVIGVNYEEDETESENESSESTLKDNFKSMFGMNIEELYAEVLYEIVHNVGCAEAENVQCDDLWKYVQEAFKVSSKKHEAMLEETQSKEPPKIRLNVEVIKASNLVPKDSNGLSDPFVTLYLESRAGHKYNTSVKTSTLSPTWEEHFSLPIEENPSRESLVLEVWDFDAAESVGEKMNKIFEVKGVQGIRKLMKEIALTASTGKHENELIGRTSIPLKAVPAVGINLWQHLEKGMKNRNRGSILIHMSFSSEKNARVALQEHRYLLHVLLVYELEAANVLEHSWNGKFSPEGEAVLGQHLAQSGLSLTDSALAKWTVFTSVHQDHPLSFSLFVILLDKITQSSILRQSEEINLFWEGCKRLLPSCYSFIRKLRKKTVKDGSSLKLATEVLKILAKIFSLDPPNGFELLPPSIYSWISIEYDTHFDLMAVLKEAVKLGALEWFEHIHEVIGGWEEDDDRRMQNFIKLIQLVRSDLQRAVERYDVHFQQIAQFKYAGTLYKTYEGKLSELAEDIVRDVCTNIKHMEDDQKKQDELNMGTTLFEVYMVLKRFARQGQTLCPDEEDFLIYKYHEWFTPAVAHWLDISLSKALTRIEKAVSLDKLAPLDDTVKFSSSAVDTLSIFHQIKIFWQQLDWPDAIGAYVFVARIVDDICQCCTAFADFMSNRVEKSYAAESRRECFEIKREWCLAVNNIDYIRQSFPPFMKELGIDAIIGRIGKSSNTMDANRCKSTVKMVIENSVDIMQNKILHLINIIATKMAPAMRKFLLEGVETMHFDVNSMDRVMTYLDDSFFTLHSTLNENNFQRVLDAIWCELSTILYEVAQSGLDKKKPQIFFANLQNTLEMLENNYKFEENECAAERKMLENVREILNLHSSETGKLIHKYYMERVLTLKNIEESPYGHLTVAASFVENTLQLEVVNAKLSHPTDSNGTCDSFVKVRLIPEENFPLFDSLKTSVEPKTLYPSYNANFCIKLSDKQKEMKNAVLEFCIKNQDYFGLSNQYIAECYLSFEDVEAAEAGTIHILPLSVPEVKDDDLLRALEYRQSDKQAREFMKKLKKKACVA